MSPISKQFYSTSFAEEHLEAFNSEVEDKYLYHHPIIPDFLITTNRQKNLVDSSITFLNGFTEEGVKELDSQRLSKFFSFNYTVIGKKAPPQGVDASKPKPLSIETMRELLDIT